MPTAPCVYAAPKFVTLVPEELDVRVYRHAIDSLDGAVDCWSYVTDGMRRHGQKELVLTLRRRPDEGDDDSPRDPLDFFKLVYRQAREGKCVEAGGYSRFVRSGGFLGRDGAVGMAYVPASPLRGVNYPDKPLATFLVTAEEVEVIRQVGAYRLLSLLGYRSTYFPYPPWSERSRAGLLTCNDLKSSLLGQLPLAFVPGLMVRRQAGQVHLHWANEKYSQEFAKRLPKLPRGPFVLMTDADPEAKARLVWRPGMPVDAVALDHTPDASLTGGFIAILPAGVDEGVQVCEDGFAVRLQPTTWQSVGQALIDGESLTVTPCAGLPLVCGAPEATEPIKPAGTRFLQPADTVKQRVRTEELTSFGKRVGNVVEDHFADVKPGDGQALTLFCAVRPGQQAKYWLECQPKPLANGSQNQLLRRLGALKPTQVSAPVAWAMRFDLWGGTGRKTDFASIPQGWAEVVPVNGHPPVLSDEMLDRVWPPA